MPSLTSSPNPTLSRSSSSRTSKKVLLDALAAELKAEKARVDEWAGRMVAVEDRVEAKHREFLDEETRLSSLRDQNASTISSLRRELAKAHRALEEAQHVDEEEARAYLELLSGRDQLGGGVSPPRMGGSAVPTEADDGHSPAQRKSSAALSHAAGAAPRPAVAPSEMVAPLPDSPTSPTLSHLPHPVNPTSAITSHPLQSYAPTVPLGVTVSQGLPTSSDLQLERSIWHESVDDAQRGTSGQGRWSKILPAIVRRRSSSRTRV
ncbi:hypothetical protein Rt10032_c14g5381 [Rhodotorula toruloides]|uniref:Uncharacterized protein n=1 Tax=Rhodotorula toruloides TaxID=5286 RepID=A0A511KPC0_RHOTO|nr:hypothetical protein Rt10032_c14g5381 [Rhodotorula toruloides]